ncbi:MAG: OmpA family protein [Pseudomonadota bacterium]
MKKLQVLTLAAVIALGSTAAFAQDGKMVITPKVSSFDFVVDYSGSMAMDFADGNEEKIAMAKAILDEINSKIPDFAYEGGLHTFAPSSEAVSMGPWNRADYAEGIASLEEDYEVYGRTTPMTAGLDKALPAIEAMPRKSAVIIVSDGEANRGPNPIAAAQNIADLNGVCLYSISLADTAAGQATMEAIGGLSSCGGSFNGVDLLDSSAAMNAFVEEVFIEKTFVAAPAPVVEEAIVLRNINFAFDSAQLNAEAQDILNEVASIIKANSSKEVLITGHTDSTGPEGYNQTLSVRRADSVRAYLVSEGVAADRISAAGDGEMNPKFNNDTAEGRKLNRRVEISFE